MSRFSDLFLMRFNGDVPLEQLGPADLKGHLVVFLHGVMGSQTNWRSIAKQVHRDLGYLVLAYDARGHGGSAHVPLDSDPDGFTPQGMARDLQNILDALSDHPQWNGDPAAHGFFKAPVDVVGHSMGGRVAYHFASQFPDRVRRLVIEDIGPVRLAPDGAKPRRHLVERILSEIPVPFTDMAAAKSWFAAEFPIAFAQTGNLLVLSAWLQTNLKETEHGVTWRFQTDGIRSVIASGRAETEWTAWSGLKCPTLLVRGETSTDLSRETFESLLKQNPTVIGREIAGAGHWVHSEQPKAFLSELVPFLRPVEF